jgi:lipopolysaccharide export LptBFGC system permease protein LptF
LASAVGGPFALGGRQPSLFFFFFFIFFLFVLTFWRLRLSALQKPPFETAVLLPTLIVLIAVLLLQKKELS